MLQFLNLNKFCRAGSIFILTLVLVCICIIFVAPVLCILLVSRYLVSKCAMKFQRGELGKMLPASSTFLASADVYNRKAVTILSAFVVDDPVIDLNLMRKHFENVIFSATVPGSDEFLYPELKSGLTQWMGYLFWKPCLNFDITDVIKSVNDIEVPPWDGKSETALQDFCMYLARERLWREGKPLWEMIIIENVHDLEEGSEKSLIIWRHHHALADGWSIFKFFMKLFEMEGVRSIQLTMPPTNAVVSTTQRPCIEIPSSAWNLIKLPFETVDLFATLITNRTTPPEFPVDDVSSCDLYSGIDSTFCLERFKRLRNMLDVDLNSLILAGISAGVRNAFKIGGKEIPQSVKITLPIPFLGHPNKLRNHFSIGVILLPIGEVDSAKRVTIIASSMKKLRRSSIPLSMFHLLRLLGSLPLPMVRFCRTRLQTAPLLLTNIVGSPEPIYFNGKLISDYTILINPPVDSPGGYAYGMALLSYCGNTKLGVVGLRNYFKNKQDPEKFLQTCIEEWTHLENICLTSCTNDTQIMMHKL